MVNEFVISRTGLAGRGFFFASLLCTLLKTLNRGSNLSEFSDCRRITRWSIEPVSLHRARGDPRDCPSTSCSTSGRTGPTCLLSSQPNRSVTIIRHLYRPPTKLREGKVFSHFCLFTGGRCSMWPLPMMDWTSPYRAPFAPGHGNSLYYDPPSRTCSNMFIVNTYGWQVGALHLTGMLSCLLLLTTFISKKVLDPSTKTRWYTWRIQRGDILNQLKHEVPKGHHENFQFLEGGGRVVQHRIPPILCDFSPTRSSFTSQIISRPMCVETN